jgi:2,4-dichlorophenol 6-monooxygenase
VAFGFTDDPAETGQVVADVLVDPARRAEVENAIAGQAIHFDLLGLQLGHVYEGPLVVGDGTTARVLDEPARDYLPSTRPGGRLPHGWLDDGTSMLDLVDPVVPTVLTRAGTEPPVVPDWATARTVAAEVWDDTFGIASDLCLVVRPDQHVAARCPVVDAVDMLERLFATTVGAAS